MSNPKGYRNAYSVPTDPPPVNLNSLKFTLCHLGFHSPKPQNRNPKVTGSGRHLVAIKVQDASFQERLLCPIRCPSFPISPPCPFHPACMLYTLSLHCRVISIHTQTLSAPHAAFCDAVPTSLVALELWIQILAL